MRIQVRPSRRRPTLLVLNLASMIDVTFLLLIYFMLTMVFTKPEDRLSSALRAKTEQASGSASDFQPQVVDVVVADGAPGYRLGARLFRDKASLTAALEPLNKATGLFIRVSNEPSTGFVLAAFQAGHDAGFEKVTYVAVE